MPQWLHEGPRQIALRDVEDSVARTSHFPHNPILATAVDADRFLHRPTRNGPSNGPTLKKPGALVKIPRLVVTTYRLFMMIAGEKMLREIFQRCVKAFWEWSAVVDMLYRPNILSDDSKFH